MKTKQMKPKEEKPEFHKIPDALTTYESGEWIVTFLLGGFDGCGTCGFWASDTHFDRFSPIFDADGDVTIKPEWATKVLWLDT